MFLLILNVSVNACPHVSALGTSLIYDPRACSQSLSVASFVNDRTINQRWLGGERRYDTDTGHDLPEVGAFPLLLILVGMDSMLSVHTVVGLGYSPS
jgi:hypothetical protein